ncbi:hypothetical protein VTI74DRAFT_1582 [Chaetomium olivicolor]
MQLPRLLRLQVMGSGAALEMLRPGAAAGPLTFFLRTFLLSFTVVVCELRRLSWHTHCDWRVTLKTTRNK